MNKIDYGTAEYAWMAIFKRDANGEPIFHKAFTLDWDKDTDEDENDEDEDKDKKKEKENKGDNKRDGDQHE